MATSDPKANDGKSIWDYLWHLLVRRRRLLLGIIGVALAFLGGLWAAAHSNADPGTPIKLWGLEYTKAKPARDIFARIEDARGVIVLTATLNDEQFPLWGNHPLGVQAPAPFSNFSFAEVWHNECFNSGKCANKSTEFLGVAFHTHRGTIDANYRAAVGTWWASIAPALQSCQQVSLSNVSIGRRLRPTANILNFEIASSDQNWAFTLVIAQQEAGSTESVLSRVTVDTASPSGEISLGRRKITVRLP